MRAVEPARGGRRAINVAGMADAAPDRPGRRTIRIAQALLVVAAAGLWAASRLTWVDLRSFDGLSPPKLVTLSGAAWSSALVPLALVLLATAVAALAVRGWPLRMLALLVAVTSLATGYLAISLLGHPGRRRARSRPRARPRADAGGQPAALPGSGDHPGDRGVHADRCCAVDASGGLVRAAQSRNT